MNQLKIQIAAIVVCAIGAACSGAGTDSVDTRSDAGLETTKPDANVCEVSGEGRPAAATCEGARDPGPYRSGLSDACNDFREGCETDADCSDGDGGRCLVDDDDVSRCTYDECFEDDDCPSGSVCVCGGADGPGNHCATRGDCRVDADCGNGGVCSPSRDFCGDERIVGFFCRTCDDECVADSDCAADDYCGFDQNVGAWRCFEPSGCACE